MNKIVLVILVFVTSVFSSYAQTIKWEGKEFEISNVKASVVSLNGEKVLKVERDLDKLPFDTNKLSATVDLPTFVKLKDLNLDSGIIEVKVLSRIQNPSPFVNAQGFIGIAFRINEDSSAYESIYLRPKAGRADNQFARNHSVQYYAYPDYKFDRLRREEFKGQYETYADVGLNEWITMRIEFAGKTAKLFLNNQKYPSFIVNDMKGKTESGSIGLWVDIGTEGYFKDLKVKKY
jgi:hypothetical protein